MNIDRYPVNLLPTDLNVSSVFYASKFLPRLVVNSPLETDDVTGAEVNLPGVGVRLSVGKLGEENKCEKINYCLAPRGWKSLFLLSEWIFQYFLVNKK